MNAQDPTLDAPSPSYVGYYGKIPDKGDFISKDLPISFTDPWHRWTKEAIASSKQQLQQSWEEAYLTAPLYHYVLSPSVCGNIMWLGVMMPSVDKVGRYYPMTLCRSISLTANPFTVFEQYQTWLEQAENLLLTCLAENFSLHHFDAALAQLNNGNDTTHSKNADDESTLTLQRFTLHKHTDATWQIPLLSTEKQSRLYPALLESMLNTFFSSYSIWRTAGSDVVAPSLIISEDLPPYQSVAALIDGQWTKWGWNAEHIFQQ